MLVFLLKLTLAWGAFAGLYALLFRHETFFQANRVYLWLTALAGLCLPFAGVFFPVENSTALPAIVLPEVVVGLQKDLEATPQSNFWPTALTWIYLAGAAVATLRFGAGLWRIFGLALGSRREMLPDGTCVFRTELAATGPFSFFGWIFVGPDFGSEKSDAQMLAHERAHVQGWHSADVLFFEVLGIVFWFHPLAHWYRRAVRVVHEYLADAASASTSDRKQYGLLLIRQAQTGPALAIANHFFTPQLKKRIVMLTKKTSSPARTGWKYALALPLVPFFTLLFQQNTLLGQTAADPTRAAWVRQLEANDWVQVDTVVTFNPETYEESVKIVRSDLKPFTNGNGELVYQKTETAPEFPGGEMGLMKFMMENMKYPEEARKAKAEGKIVVKFIIDATGRVNEAAQFNADANLNPLLVQEAIRVILSMPRWKPATHNGKPVNCTMMLPVNFRLN